MDDAWVENESPFFSGSSTASRNKPGNTKTYRRRVVEDRHVNKKKRKTSTRSKSKKTLLSPTTPPPPKRWTPLEVKRCALQTLGGSSGNPSPAALKGDALHKTRSTKTTLKKMKPYGGGMFYDKCYLSSDDEREAEQGTRPSWALSPTTDADQASFPRTTGGDTPPAKKSLLLSRTGSSSAGKGKRARRSSGSSSVFMPRLEEEEDEEEDEEEEEAGSESSGEGTDDDDEDFAEPRLETPTRTAEPRARTKNDGSSPAASDQEGQEGRDTAPRSASLGARRKGRAGKIGSNKPSSKRSFTRQVR